MCDEAKEQRGSKKMKEEGRKERIGTENRTADVNGESVRVCLERRSPLGV